MVHRFIPPHGGYRRLKSYQKAEIVFDATVYFCDRWVGRRSRTYDQMVQAARSGKQNIAEGSVASATSKETELRLTQVARASLQELLEDCRDFLRGRGLAEWDVTHRYARRMTELARLPDASYETFRRGIESDDPEIAANAIAHLVQQANFLLDRQVARLEEDFLRAGGLRERMTRARLEVRREQERAAGAGRTWRT